MGTFAVINPATGEKLAEYPDATAADIEAALASTQQTYQEWSRKTTVAERAALAGGRLESGRRGRLFIVQAWLPWPSSSQSAEAIEPAEAVEPVELIEAVEAVEPAGTSGPPGPATDDPARPEPMETR